MRLGRGARGGRGRRPLHRRPDLPGPARRAPAPFRQPPRARHRRARHHPYRELLPRRPAAIAGRHLHADRRSDLLEPRALGRDFGAQSDRRDRRASAQPPLDRFLFALGIRHVGEVTARDLARRYGAGRLHGDDRGALALRATPRRWTARRSASSCSAATRRWSRRSAREYRPGGRQRPARFLRGAAQSRGAGSDLRAPASRPPIWSTKSAPRRSPARPSSSPAASKRSRATRPRRRPKRSAPRRRARSRPRPIWSSPAPAPARSSRRPRSSASR